MVRRFRNLDPVHTPNGWGALLRWQVVDRLLGRREIRPPGPPADRVAPDLDAIHEGDGARVTWIGHASFLISFGDRHVVVDPVFSKRIGWVVRRHVRPGLAREALPPVAAVLITHNHYDHLDTPSIESFGRETPIVCPAGLGRGFVRRGFRDVREMGWWDDTVVPGARVCFVPARHWSRRLPGDTNRSWWGGYVIDAASGSARVYHAGDSAAFDGFRRIGRRFPGIDVALMPIGAYAPRWFMGASHLSPEEAGEAFVDTGARAMVPMHWGTFHLADESLRDPIERMRTWWAAREDAGGRSMWEMAVGETRVIPCS